jgi:hypothetical protein
MISKGFGLVASFASVKASSVCIHLSCPVCIQAVVQSILENICPKLYAAILPTVPQRPIIPKFNISRTVHLRIILVGNQLAAQFFYDTFI